MRKSRKRQRSDREGRVKELEIGRCRKTGTMIERYFTVEVWRKDGGFSGVKVRPRHAGVQKKTLHRRASKKGLSTSYKCQTLSNQHKLH